MAYSAKYTYQIIDRFSKPLERIARANDRFRTSISHLANRVDRMQNSLNTSTQSLKNFRTAAGSAIDPTRGFAQATEKVNIRVQGTATKLHLLGNRFSTIGQGLANFKTAIGGAAMLAGIYRFSKSSSELSDSMADVGRVTGLSGRQLEIMQQQLQRVGRATGRSAIGLAQIAYEGGKLGIANDQLVAFTQTVMKTAVAFDMTDQEAGRAIGSIRAKLGLSVQAVDDLMQRLNFLADNTSASGNQMIEIVERTSGTFSALKIPADVTAGWAAFANQMEISPQLAASGLNQMMMRMMQMPGMLEKMLKDPKKSVSGFLKKLESMPEIKRNTAIIKMFGLEASRFVMKAVANTKQLDQAMQLAKSTKALGSMDREFQNILSRSSTAAKRIKETFVDIGRAIGRVFIRVFDRYSDRIRQATEFALDFIKAHPGMVKMIGAIGLVLAGIAAVAVPFGLLLSMIGAALPALAALSASFFTVVLPVAAVVAGVTAWIAAWSAMLMKSAALRQSFVNLYDAISPLIEIAKTFIFWIGNALADAFGMSGDGIRTWGDMASIYINAIAALIHSLVQTVIYFGEWWGKVFTGDVVGLLGMIPGVGGLLESVGLGTAKEKAGARSQDTKVEMSGRIDVTASGGAKVNRADIGLNTGYNNMAVAH